MQQQSGARPRRIVSRPIAFARAGLLRFSVVEFLISLIVMMVATPLIGDLRNGDLIESALVTIVLSSAVLAIGARSRLLIVGSVLVLPALACRWLNHYRPDIMPPEPYMLAASLFIIFVLSQLLRFVLNAPRVNFEVLCGGIATFLLMGVLWATAYMFVARMMPGAFVSGNGVPVDLSHDPFPALYFSFITLSTVGYGDITPVAKAARLLAVMESTSGMLFVAILIARLVALHTNETSATRAGGSTNP